MRMGHGFASAFAEREEREDPRERLFRTYTKSSEIRCSHCGHKVRVDERVSMCWCPNCGYHKHF